MRTLVGKAFLQKRELERMGSDYPIGLEYYKTIVDIDNSAKYGLEIVMRQYASNSTNIEAKHIENVTNNEKFADLILEDLKKYHVTPVALEDIAYDLVKKYECV